jgi:hypothetical protein
MSRLHACAATIADLTARFGLGSVADIVVSTETFEGLPGLAIFERNGKRRLRMTWGYPRFPRAMRTRCKESGRIGLEADLNNPMGDKMVRDFAAIFPAMARPMPA